MVISGPVSTWAAIFHLWGSNWRVPYYHCVQAVPMVRLWVLWIFNLCTDVDACNCTCGLYKHHKTLRESAWKLTLEKNSLATLRNWTCVSIVSDLTLDQWSCVPSSFLPSCLSCFWFVFVLPLFHCFLSGFAFFHLKFLLAAKHCILLKLSCLMSVEIHFMLASVSLWV